MPAGLIVKIRTATGCGTSALSEEVAHRLPQMGQERPPPQEVLDVVVAVKARAMVKEAAGEAQRRPPRRHHDRWRARLPGDRGQSRRKYER